MKLFLRQATNDDAAFCEALNRRNMDRYRAVRQIRRDAELFRRSWAEFDNLLILDDIEPVGLLRLCDEDGTLGLRDLQVVPERQGQGIGTWAVRQTQALALERGSVCVQLRVYEENPAARLYRRLGFEIRYVANGVIHMAWTLPLYRSSAAAGTLEPRGTR